MSKSNDYTPRGCITLLLAAIQAEPQREFTGPEASAIMGCPPHALPKRLQPALRAKMIYRQSFGHGRPMLLRGTPFPADASQRWKEGAEHACRGWSTDPDDLRIPRVVPGWTPPKMQSPRG